MAELKKCPFCGGEAKVTCISTYGGIETISCKKCHVDIRRIWCKDTPLESEVDVLEKWNNRATEAEIRAKAYERFAEKLKWELGQLIFPDSEKFAHSIKEQEQICHQNMTLKRAIRLADYLAEQLKGE